MPVNPELVGRVFPPTAPYLVGREKVREFARAVFADDPQQRRPRGRAGAGYADVVAPPTFAIVVQEQTLQQLLAEPDSGIVLRVVHGDQRFSYTRPIVAGDELTGTLTVADRPRLGGNSMVTSEAEITDAAGAHVVTATSDPVVGEGDAVIRLAVGDIVAERTVHLTRESLVRYAGASGDFNPIHYRDDVASAVGLPGVLAHGMLTMGLAVQPVVTGSATPAASSSTACASPAPSSSTPRPAPTLHDRRQGRARSTTTPPASTSP